MPRYRASATPRRSVTEGNPLLVVVDVLLAIGQASARPAADLPLRVRAAGLQPRFVVAGHVDVLE